MIFGVNAEPVSRKSRTGVEEYAYQLLKHLAVLRESEKHRFILYTNQLSGVSYEMREKILPVLPGNFELKVLKNPFFGGRFWTQARLSWEMIKNGPNRPDVLFIPAHALPIIHPENSVVTIHGLEYEYYPEYYSKRERHYLRWSTKYALKKARKIIVVSENTKKDLIELYGAEPAKIKVIYHGINSAEKDLKGEDKERALKPKNNRYLLYLGRIEMRKNIQGLVEAFGILKKDYKLPHKLVLAGGKGYGYDKIKFAIRNSQFAMDIIMKGYVPEEEKWRLLKNADVFIFCSFYEGFGFPPLEAQSVGTPVIVSSVSSFPEVIGESGVLVNPKNPVETAETVRKVLYNRVFREELIKKGFRNVERFSWEKCARETLEVLTS